MPKIKNILIFGGLGIAMILIYVFFIKKSTVDTPLTSSTPISTEGSPDLNSGVGNPSLTQDFLSLLLSVKSIKLDDTIFSDSAFLSLQDSSITLVPDGTEGRKNPFAPIGVDNVSTLLTSTPSIPVGAH